jgi:crossover junction endodeoxyribonuclease RuvC
MITVVGIDPGLAATGIAVVRGKGLTVSRYAYGVARTSPQSGLSERLNKIYTQISAFLADEKPSLMVVEDVFSLEKYPKSGITLGRVSGVILLAGCRNAIPVIQIPVREAKQILTGSGNAGKQQLEESVRRRLNHPSPIRPYHSADALSLALIGLYRWGGNDKK